MALTQVQIIRSLGDALAWFERELAWGVPAAELNHLTGRIGELYAAMITRGQMALAVNQHGYDVVGRDGEHISVKTITTSTHVTFRKSTFHHVDRVIVLRINIEDGEVSIEELLDCPAGQLATNNSDGSDSYLYRIKPSRLPARSLDEMTIVASATVGDAVIAQYENGTILVSRSGVSEVMAKPALRRIAAEIGVSPLNGANNPMNTRQLGAAIIAAVTGRGGTGADDSVLP